MIYNPCNWYWSMEGDKSKIWSSSTMGFIKPSNREYQEWVKDHIAPPMSWPSLFDLMLRVKPEAAAEIARSSVGKLNPEQAAHALIMAGLKITSKSNKSLDGTYPLEIHLHKKLEVIYNGLNAGKEFPGKADSIALKDMDGILHSFDIDSFKSLFKAIGDYIYAIHSTEAALMDGHTVAWPKSVVELN